MAKRSPTTKDVGLLHQLFNSNQLSLAPEFQRNSVWPTAAKAYLIDTILNDRPIPLLFIQRMTSPQTGRPIYTVIDGQQRLRAIFEFMDDRYRLAKGTRKFSNKRFSELDSIFQNQITNYDLIVQELSGYSDDDIRDMFVRINRYVVQLSPQEMRHAKGSGRFHDFVEKLGKDKFWKDNKVFSPKMLRRMRSVEFSAELTILLIEGPQDKKSSVDLYYGRYQHKFTQAAHIKGQLTNYLRWILRALPDFSTTRYRKPVDLYSLIGAVDLASEHGTRLSRLSPTSAGTSLLAFEKKTKAKQPSGMPRGILPLQVDKQTI